jgi:HlyD family secretion protein
MPVHRRVSPLITPMRRVVLLLFIFASAAVIPSLPAASSSLSSLFDSLSSALPTSRLARVDAPAYRTSAVERGDLVATVKAAGTVNALVMVEVGSQISGQVKELYADFNSAVAQGQVIARIDPETYEAKVAQAEAELEIAKALVPVQRAQIEREAAELDSTKAAHDVGKAQTERATLAFGDTKREFDRKQLLAAQAVVSMSDWERTQSAHRSAEAQLTASRAQELSHVAAIRRAQAALHMAEAQLLNILAQVKQRETLLRQARIDLERTYIRAPVTGTVINRAVSSGQTVAASLQAPTLFTIAQDLTRMQVEASVVEADVSRFGIGQTVTFTVDAHPGHRFTGAVKQIRKAPQVVQNVVTYVVVIATENPEGMLLPGMTANLQVVVARREGVLKVPNTALRFRPSGQLLDEERATRGAQAEVAGIPSEEAGAAGRVFVLNFEGQPILIPLRVGITDGRMTEVMAGNLAEGQPVIIGPGTQRSGTNAVSSFKLW